MARTVNCVKLGREAEGLDFPPYGFPSKEAEEGTVVKGRKIPGLGSPRVAEAVSVWSVEVPAPDPAPAPV